MKRQRWGYGRTINSYTENSRFAHENYLVALVLILNVQYTRCDEKVPILKKHQNSSTISFLHTSLKDPSTAGSMWKMHLPEQYVVLKAIFVASPPKFSNAFEYFDGIVSNLQGNKDD